MGRPHCTDAPEVPGGNRCENEVDIVLVDPADEFRLSVAGYLYREGYHVQEVKSGADFQKHLEQAVPSLAILEVDLPDADGLSLALEASENYGTSIMFVTQRTSPFDRVAALELCADDYICKPVELREILARVRSVLRRRDTARSSGGTPVYSFCGYTLDLIHRRLSDNRGEPVPLTGGEMALLAALLASKGRPMSRERLLSIISKRDVHDVDERSVDTLVRRLRRKIEANPARPALIQTVHGVGYRLAAD
ncbi:hypothetical protein CAI21_18325 [Alkalilimnicola ehrlichii]|uniref:response regulator transcription factor n=1 Tax=Alkalilimnicola ehrlichii TaxID=351052 RepID=UPI000E2E5FC0|nr:response regulator transcription factor [Alkalilimnicola ehrlichii]RFA25812.1 hypothetical protein CAI21_18325 [Alkalilimnicola ehrlichii]